EINLLRYGRHFRLESGAKVIIGRNEGENKILKGFQDENDILMEVTDVGSPIVILKKNGGMSDIKKAAILCVRYSDSYKEEDIDIRVKLGDKQEKIIKFNSF
ncbi:MAG: tRNA (5-methylaminomethyl-2-thiouridylate)-methyltransferase, partial [Candidatus Thorarchaeota archaeon]